MLAASRRPLSQSPHSRSGRDGSCIECRSKSQSALSISGRSSRARSSSRDWRGPVQRGRIPKAVEILVQVAARLRLRRIEAAIGLRVDERQRQPARSRSDAAFEQPQQSPGPAQLVAVDQRRDDHVRSRAAAVQAHDVGHAGAALGIGGDVRSVDLDGGLAHAAGPQRSNGGGRGSARSTGNLTLSGSLAWDYRLRRRSCHAVAEGPPGRAALAHATTGHRLGPAHIHKRGRGLGAAWRGVVLHRRYRHGSISVPLPP